jgi:hypothetical protein
MFLAALPAALLLGSLGLCFESSNTPLDSKCKQTGRRLESITQQSNHNIQRRALTPLSPSPSDDNHAAMILIKPELLVQVAFRNYVRHGARDGSAKMQVLTKYLGMHGGHVLL